MKALHKITLLGLLCLTSCGLPDTRIKRQVAESEIIGTWELDPASSALAVDHDGDDYLMEPGQAHTIVFNADGTCHYRSVMQMPTRHVDAAGTWCITPTDDDPRGCHVDLELRIDGEGTSSFSLDLREESGELILWEFWGDPDLWNFLEYRKAEGGRSEES